MVIADFLKIDTQKVVKPADGVVFFKQPGWYGITAEYGPVYYKQGQPPSISATADRCVVTRDFEHRFETVDGFSVSAPLGSLATVIKFVKEG